MDNNNFEGFNTPLTPIRLQSQLGKETARRYKEGDNLVRLSMARVVKVNYKYNTVDVVTTKYHNALTRSHNDNGKFSARLPVSFGGRTPDGKVYGTNTLVTVGSLVLIGFLEGSKDTPIVLNIYGEVDNQSQLTRTTFLSADESDEAIQQELWQLFTLYPSMTYKNIDGRGNQEITFSGRSFMYITESDKNNDYVQDTGFDYEHLPSSRYANGEQIEPASPNSPTILYVHQGVYDRHRVTFFIKSDGTVRLGSRHLDGGGITFQEMKTDGSFFIVQKKDTINPEEPSEKFSRIGIRDNGEVILEAKDHILEVTNRGILINGRPLASIGGGGSVDLSEVQKQLDDMNEKVIDVNASINILDGKIIQKADATTVNNINKTLTKHEANFVVAFNEINSMVKKEEYDIDLDKIREHSEELFGEVNKEIKDVINGVTELDGFIKGAFKDGIIDQAEAIAIQNYINILNTEKKDVDSRFNEIYYNLYLPDAYAENLSLAKVAFDNRHIELIQAIEEAIADAKISPLESEKVDVAFSDYGEAIATLTTHFEVAIDQISYQRATQALYDAEKYAKDYADNLKKILDGEIEDTNESLTNLNLFVNGAFHDGIIEESEAQAIAKYINLLSSEKEDVSRRYDALIDSPYLSEGPKGTLTAAHESFNTAHNRLIEAINIAIEDGKTTHDEAALVDIRFDTYGKALGTLTTALEEAVDDIAKSMAEEAEYNAKKYANDLKAAVDGDIEDVRGRVGTLRDYVNGAFHDGVIEEAEAQAIAKYINTLQTEKSDMDERFNEIYYNVFLDEPEKTELHTRKTTFNTAHDNLIEAINIAIEDGKTTNEESYEVDRAFQNYATTLGELARYYEVAIDKIASNKAAAAEEAAKEHANSLRAKSESEIKQLSDEISLRVKSETFNTVVETVTKRVEGAENSIKDVEKEVEELAKNATYRAEIVSTNGNIFRNGNINTTLFCRVYRGSQDVTDITDASRFVWYRVSEDPEGDEAWNRAHRNAGKSVTVSANDFTARATFNCDIIE